MGSQEGCVAGVNLVGRDSLCSMRITRDAEPCCWRNDEGPMLGRFARGQLAGLASERTTSRVRQGDQGVHHNE
jgi:hypothetical protein